MKKFDLLGWITVTLLAACVAPHAEAGDVILAAEGHAKFSIALAEDAIPAERTAARELKTYLDEISGANFSIRNEAEVPAGEPQILVGAGTRAKKLLPGQDWGNLKTDGIIIKTVGQHLVLAGGRPRGTLYAVHSFLEDTLGVRWWTPDESFVPKLRTLKISPQNVVYTPRIQVREAYYPSVRQDPIFATRLKNNGQHQKQEADWGGHVAMLGFVHTFNQLLPTDKYFKDHPEWYSDPNNGGKPCTSNSPMPASQQWQICLSNEAARCELTVNVLAYLRANPQAHIVSVSQNDNQNRCTCAACREAETKEGSPSGPLLHFVNAIAREVRKEFPSALVETLAYQYTQKPPKHVRPESNVIIRLCSVEANFARPLGSEANTVFRDDTQAWRAIAPRMWFWDYVTNFSNFVIPHPNMPQLGANIRFFADNHAIGLFEQGDMYSNGAGDFVALRVWLLSHLMWNPELDQNKLTDEFLRGYYGPAAPHLRAYLDTVQSSVTKVSGDFSLSLYQNSYSFLTLDVMNTATRQFRAAQAAVRGDAVLTARVQREELALEHAWLLRYRILRREVHQTNQPFEGPADPTKAATDFVTKLRQYKVVACSESERLDVYAPRLAKMFEPSVKLPEFVAGKDADDLIDAQENTFLLVKRGTWVNIVEDLAASNGSTARLPGAFNEWALQCWLQEDEAYMKAGPWHCYVMARVQARENAAPGLAFSCGIYDVARKRDVTAMKKTLAQVPSGSEYQIIDLGKHDLSSSMYVWVAGPKRQDVEAVWVDRILLVREP